MRGGAFAHRELGVVMVRTPGKRVEAESAEQHRQHQRIAGIFLKMRLGAAHRDLRLALDRGGHDLDVLALARVSAGGQLPCVRGHVACFGSLHVELMQAGARDMRQRETCIRLDRAIESLLGPMPGRQHAIHAVPVMRRGAVGGGGQRQIISVPVHFLIP